jgi:protein-S-isoprenylcysteine O-methyltransferase Ste14
MAKPSLYQQAIFHLLRLVVLTGLLVFVPAGSFYYWQGLVFLAAFFVPCIFVTFYLLEKDPALAERRMRGGAKAEGQRKQKIIMRLAGPLSAALVCLPALDHRFGWSRVGVPWVLAGDGLVVLGLVAVFFVFRANSFTAATIAVEKNQKIVTTGPYRHVRHPMYAGAMLAVVGTPLALGSFWGLGLAFAMGLVVVWRLTEEEKFLAANLTGYAEYRTKTRYRLVPGVY